MHFDRKCAGGMTVNEYLNNRNTPGYSPGIEPDAGYMEKHLREWFRGVHSDGCIDIMIISEIAFEYLQFGLDEIDTLVGYVAHANQMPGTSVWYRPALVRRDFDPNLKASDMFVLAPGFWAEFRGKVAIAAAAVQFTISMPPTLITATEDDTAVAYWKTDETHSDYAAFAKQNKAISKRFGGHIVTAKPHILLRLPGTLRWSDKPPGSVAGSSDD